jgi:hypothetical protein
MLVSDFNLVTIQMIQCVGRLQFITPNQCGDGESPTTAVNDCAVDEFSVELTIR